MASRQYKEGPTLLPSPNPAIVLGSFYTALPIVRSLGKKGIDVFCCDIAKGPAAYSRYIAKFELVSKQRFIDDPQALVAWKAQHGLADFLPVLVPTSDFFVEYLYTQSQTLSPHFLFYNTHREALFDKKLLDASLSAKAIAKPHTAFIDNLESFAKDSISLLGANVIVKPVLQRQWQLSDSYLKSFGAQKVHILKNDSNLLPHLQSLLAFGPLCLQEHIPGPSENLFYYVGMRTNQGQQLFSFVSQKIMTLPDTIGSEVKSVAVQNNSLCTLGDQILEALDIKGIAGVDFKRDERDGTWKVIEINPRFGLTDGMIVKAGIDAPFLYYEELTKNNQTALSYTYSTPVYWCWLEGQVEWWQAYGKSFGHKLQGLAQGLTLTPTEWAAWSLCDPKPFLFAFSRFCISMLKRLCKRISSSSNGQNK